MYNEFKTKCEQFRSELMAMLPNVTDNGRIDTPGAGNLHYAINRTANDINSIIDAINVYYSED